MIRTAQRLTLLAAAITPAAFAATSPRPAPRLFITGNHGVRFTVPGGLYYCPIPDGWVGSDHGTVLFFTPPRACDDRADTPSISVYYGYNVPEYDHGDGQPRPPRTDEEARRDSCTGGEIAPPFRLLGHTVMGCESQAGTRIAISVTALYVLDTDAEDPPDPDHILTVSLSTRIDRQARDLRTFRSLLAGITICTPDWAHARPGRRACDEFDGSWW